MKASKTFFEHELEENSFRFLEAQKLAKIGMWEVNMRTGNVKWSSVVYDIFDCDPTLFEPSISSINKMLLAHDKISLWNGDIDSFDKQFNSTHQLKTAKGEIKYVNELGHRVQEEQDPVYRGTIQDITPLKETEKALTLEKKRLDLIISNSNLGTYDWDHQKGYYTYNEYYSKILGYEDYQIQSLKLEEWFKSVHPDDLSKMIKFFEQHQGKSIIQYEFEIRLKHKKGHWVWVLNNGQIEGLSSDLVPREHSGIIVDINERKKAELELDRTKALLLETNKITKTGGWSWNLRTGEIDWTENTRNICEVDENFQPNYDEIFEFIVDQDNVPNLKSKIETSFRLNKKFVTELELRSGKGNKFWVKIIGIPETQYGQLQRFHGTIQNIDEQKSNEFKLNEKTKQYNELVENIPVGVYKLNRDGELNYMSPPFQKMIGIQDEDFDTTAFASEVVHPADLEMFLVANQKALDNYEYFSLEFRIVVDQKTRWVKATSEPNKDSDGNWYWFGTLTDTTNRKQVELKIQENEKQLQNIISSMKEALLFYDKAGTIKFLNESAVEMLQIDRSDLLGKTLSSTIVLLLDDEGNELQPKDHPVARALSEKKSFNDVRVQLFNTNTQKLIWIAANIKIVEEENTHWALVTFNDITERVNGEKQLLETKKVAEAANLAKSSFLANMSHEIRTPLNGVIGFADLLRKTNLNTLQDDYTKHIYHSANSLLEIINDILDFSKIEAGKLDLQIEEIDGLKLVESACTFITYQAAKKDIELVIDYQKEVPRIFKADELRLRQVLINLLGNAVKFTEAGTIVLRVSTIKANKLQFEVIDTGIGINKEQQKRIFSAFEQADVSTTRKFGGSGLGLTISNKLLNLMDSKLNLKSELNKGSTFLFNIPLQKDSISMRSWREEISIKNIHNVLLVDDNPILNEALRDFLNTFELKVSTKNSAIEAHQSIISEEPFDLILIDEAMSHLSGIDLLDMLSEKSLITKSPIIFFHKHIESAFFKSKHEQNNNIYPIPKPLLNSELINTILTVDGGAGRVGNSSLGEDSISSFNGSLQLKKVLVAEDNEVNQFLITRILENLLPDTELIHAENGEIAVEKYKLEDPDLILMDIQMPVMSGIVATEKIRALENSGVRIPIIALSAGVLKNEKEDALNGGIDDFLEKPLVQDDLIKALVKLKNEGKITEQVEEEDSSSLQIFNKQELLSRLSHNHEHYLSFISLAKENMRTFERQLIEITEIENLQALRALLHKLRGTALAACFENLALLINEFKRPESYNQKVNRYLNAKIIPEVKKLITLLQEEDEKNK